MVHFWRFGFSKEKGRSLGDIEEGGWGGLWKSDLARTTPYSAFLELTGYSQVDVLSLR